MEPIDPVYGTTTLLLIAAAAVALLLVLIMVVKLHAFVSLVLVSVVTAIAVGFDFAEIPDVLFFGFADTLGSVALLVAFGVMLGRLLEITGGAQVLADTLIGRFGEKRAPFALGVAALLFGFPIFFDAGLVVFLPIILTVARRFGGSLLYYALPAAGAFAAGLFSAVATGYLKDNSRIKEDTAMGIVFTGMFGLGIVLFSRIETDQHLTHILFGDMLGVTWGDLIETAIIAGGTLLIVFTKRRDFLLYAFDPQHARAIGLPVSLLHYGLLAMLSLTIVASLKARGVPHEYHVYEDEGHGWRRTDTIESFYETLDAFLRQFVVYA